MQAQGGKTLTAHDALGRGLDAGPVEPSQAQAIELSLESIGRRRTPQLTRPSARRRVPEPFETDEPLTQDGAILDDAGDVASSPRDSTRRRLLAFADVVGILVAYTGVWLFAPPENGNLTD